MLDRILIWKGLETFRNSTLAHAYLTKEGKLLPPWQLFRTGLVALYPNAISDTSEYTYTHRIEGDILRLTLTAPWAEGGEVRYTLARQR